MAATLVGCTDQKPAGQVIATVNGKEITSQDLQAEYRATGINNAPQLLRNVIDRKLLAATATDAPSDPADLVRAKEALRAQRAIQQLSKGFAVPNDTEVKQYIDSHPLQFRDRQIFQINQIVVADPKLKDNIKNVETMADAERTLKSLDAKYQSEHRILDSVELPQQMVDVFQKAKQGEVHLVANPQQLVLFTVEGQAPVKLTEAQEMNLARNIISTQNAKKKVADSVIAMEKAAKIEYKDNKITGKAGDTKSAATKDAAPANAVAPAASDSAAVNATSAATNASAPAATPAPASAAPNGTSK